MGRVLVIGSDSETGDLQSFLEHKAVLVIEGNQDVQMTFSPNYR